MMVKFGRNYKETRETSILNMHVKRKLGISRRLCIPKSAGKQGTQEEGRNHDGPWEKRWARKAMKKKKKNRHLVRRRQKGKLNAREVR